MTALRDMSVTEAASKGIEILLRDYATEHGYDSFEEFARRQVRLEDNGSFDVAGAWETAKGEARKGTLDGITAEQVAEYGGEGQGDDYWMVISVSDGLTTRYFRRDGWYSSYGGGGELDDETREVTPSQRMVTYFE